MTRYAGILSALLLTGLLLISMPGLLRQRLSDTGRTADSLKQPRDRTMVVWVTSWEPGDRRLLSGLCTAFEKQQPGLRIYLRRADAQELYAPDAVLPDVVLHGQGEIASPEGRLLPMTAPDGYPEGVLWSGSYQGQLLAVPLWYSPNVLCLPGEWFAEEPKQQSPASGSYFQLATPAPDLGEQPVTLQSVPWRRLAEGGVIYADTAIALPQLLLVCPAALRGQLAGCRASMEPPPPEAAVIRSLQSHQAAGDGRVALPLPTVTSLRVRYASLCSPGEDAAAFVRFLATAARAAGEHRLAHANGLTDTGDGLLRDTLSLAQGGLLLPNAFTAGAAHICLEDFAAGADPVATLLKLR